MKYLAIVLSLFLVGCVITKSAGGYDISGVVVESATNNPIEGVTVYLKYSAVSFWGSHSKEVGYTLTNKSGEFYISAEKVRLWGGTGGGLDGAVHEWPTVWVEKDGYLSSGIDFIAPSLDKYQNMQIRIKSKGSQ
ncbi:hypothetical protein QSV34_06480 [Porticoccus sp. W117]|uniref:hypothetical protein n=1 Tax=Porticoccus sp. W117 TaxID=3054777 RepID=UPI002598BC53|nr:hypothetical protein [Porticoccus sp. W117]MDM3870999.1 hypothetical protein [Porticoccus sp. W117]